MYAYGLCYFVLFSLIIFKIYDCRSNNHLRIALHLWCPLKHKYPKFLPWHVDHHNDCCHFISLSIHLCVEHYRHDALALYESCKFTVCCVISLRSYENTNSTLWCHSQSCHSHSWLKPCAIFVGVIICRTCCVWLPMAHLQHVHRLHITCSTTGHNLIPHSLTSVAHTISSQVTSASDVAAMQCWASYFKK